MRVLKYGLDQWLASLDDPGPLEGDSALRLEGRSFALLAHGASVTGTFEPAHLALERRGRPPAFLLGPEHGYYGVEQDMVPEQDRRDPWTGIPIRSLYGAAEGSLRPAPEIFAEVDLLVIDLQDIGSRYYTYAATAVWAAEAAAAAGKQVWVLDRPNPLGPWVEGGLREPGFDSFVGAFEHPVTHGLTLGELVSLEASQQGWAEAVEIWRLEGWSRQEPEAFEDRPWVAPSPNMPTLTTARLYPGGCLLEATTLSEGRGTTQPFQLLGAPGLDPQAVADRLEALDLAGLSFLPTYFRPQFQKHAGEICGGVEILLPEPAVLRPYRAGVEMLAALRDLDPEICGWRREPYEFVVDRPAIDLLTGSAGFRQALESGHREDLDAWILGWRSQEEAFCARAAPHLLYPGKLRPRSEASP